MEDPPTTSLWVWTLGRNFNFFSSDTNFALTVLQVSARNLKRTRMEKGKLATCLVRRVLMSRRLTDVNNCHGDLNCECTVFARLRGNAGVATMTRTCALRQIYLSHHTRVKISWLSHLSRLCAPFQNPDKVCFVKGAKFKLSRPNRTRLRPTLGLSENRGSVPSGGREKRGLPHCASQ